VVQKQIPACDHRFPGLRAFAGRDLLFILVDYGHVAPLRKLLGWVVDKNHCPVATQDYRRLGDQHRQGRRLL